MGISTRRNPVFEAEAQGERVVRTDQFEWLARAGLRARGVVFEEYDLPGMVTVDGIADIDGNYPSKGTGERGAWFYDSEGNLIGLGQPVGTVD